MVESDWLYCGVGLQEVPKTEQSSFTMVPNCKIKNINGSCALDFNPTHAAGEFVSHPHLMNLNPAWQSGAPDSAVRVSSVAQPGGRTQRTPRLERQEDQCVPVLHEAAEALEECEMEVVPRMRRRLTAQMGPSQQKQKR